MQDTAFRLLLVGDVMLGRLVNDVLKVEPAAYVWGSTLPLFHEADVRLCNLECVIADRGSPWSATPKVFHFRSDAKNIAALDAAHIDAVSMANNHVLDFGYEALFDMLRLLQQAGIRSAGAGATFREASTPAIWEVQERKLGLMAFTDNEPIWAASEGHAGIWYIPIQMYEKQAQHLFELVRQAKTRVSCLIVSAHWGPNWGYAPPPEHQGFAHALIDAGADIVFGHSGHVVRGIEVYRNKPIIYCAGDFIDDYAVDPVERNDQSFLFIVELYETVPSRLLLYPTIISEYQAQRTQKEEGKVIVEGMQQRCKQLGTEAKWNEQEARLEIEISSSVS